MSRGITDQDRVIVQGRYLVYEQDPSRRFLMQGMAFPVPLKPESYNEDGWIAVLKQLREASPHINTLRLYRTHMSNYTLHEYGNPMEGFYQAAADLGFYLLVPLTAAQGDGVLNRGKAAPLCYNEKLFRYGAHVIESVKDYPNVLGGVLGNEVLNSLKDWPAAPCLLAYARDLKRFHPSFPLIYTTQHDGLTAVVTPAATAQLLLNYLTCHIEDSATIDILGINIESWCSSLQTFELNEDGSVGSYADLYQHLVNATIPLIFSELGCSQILYNRDNGLGVTLGDRRTAREWNQVSVVETTMADEWSGFIAYAYDGPFDFRMTTGGPWDGIHPLTFNLDMENYVKALEDASALVKDERILVSNVTTNATMSPPTCASVHEFLEACCNVNLMDVNEIPSYFNPQDGGGILLSEASWMEASGQQRVKNLICWSALIVPMVGTMLYILNRMRGARESARAMTPDSPNKQGQTRSVVSRVVAEPTASYNTFA